MENSEVRRFEQGTEAAAWMTAFASNAVRSVDIFSHTLAPELFAQAELIDAVSALARKSAASKVRVLVRDTRPLHGIDHAMVNLARRLPSHIMIRKLVEDTAPANIGYLCADESELVFFNDEHSFQGFAREGARAESRHFLEAFNHMWLNQSATDTNLRLLAL